MQIRENAHIHSVTVPGAAAGWVDAVEQWGRLPLSQVLGPAIELAEQGLPVAPVTANAWARRGPKSVTGYEEANGVKRMRAEMADASIGVLPHCTLMAGM